MSLVTLKTIAEEAGVSTVTVSNVIHKNYKKVSAENIEKINRIIEKYHYVPNATARSLAMKKSMIIGIVIPNVGEDDNFLKSPYNAEMIGILEKEIRMRGYYVMIRSVSAALDAVPLIRNWNVDGVIILGATSKDVPVINKALSLPVMFVDTYSSENRFSNVGVNDEKGGYLATRYLVNQGHEDIWFVGPDIQSEGVIRSRYLGYEKAMQESGLESHTQHVYAKTTSYECGVEVGKEIAFAKGTVTAVFVTADILAIGIMEGLRLSGKRIPEDISVVGFDNLPEAQYAWPKLTTITQNIPQKAAAIAEELFRLLEKENGDKKNMESEYIQKQMDVEIVERNSVKGISR